MSLSSVLLRGRAPPGVRRRLSSSNDSLPTESYSTERDSPLLFRRLPNDLNTRSCLCSSADEALVALGGRAGVVQLFEAEKFLAGKSYGVLRDVDEPRDAQVVTMSWSRDLLATGSHAGTKIWDVPEQKVLGHIDAEGTSDVSFNGHYSSWFVLATCARESSVKIWDLRELRSTSESSAAKRVLRDQHGHRFRKARWSPAEPYLATIHSKDVWIWDMRLTEKPCTIFSAPGSFNVVDIDWSPKNSDRLISINAAGSMHLWSNRAPKSPIWSQITHRSTLAAFSKDGDAVLALGEPGATLRVFDAYNLARVSEQPCYTEKVTSFDYLKSSDSNSTFLAVLYADSSTSTVEIPPKELGKCHGDSNTPNLPFHDGIFKGSLHTSLTYSRSAPVVSVLHEPVTTRDATVQGGSRGAGVQLGLQRCGICFSRDGAVAVFAVESEDASDSGPFAASRRDMSSFTRLTYLLAGDEYLLVSDETSAEMESAELNRVRALLHGSGRARKVFVADVRNQLSDLLSDSLGGHYDLLRNVGGDDVNHQMVAVACTRNAGVAVSFSELEIASLWRLAAVAFEANPHRSYYSAMMLYEIAMQMERSRPATKHMSDTVAFFRCVCAALPLKSGEAEQIHVKYERDVRSKGEKVRQTLRLRGAPSR